MDSVYSQPARGATQRSSGYRTEIGQLPASRHANYASNLVYPQLRDHPEPASGGNAPRSARSRAVKSQPAFDRALRRRRLGRGRRERDRGGRIEAAGVDLRLEPGALVARVAEGLVLRVAASA